MLGISEKLREDDTDDALDCYGLLEKQANICETVSMYNRASD
jgi:hypothetical protein